MLKVGVHLGWDGITFALDPHTRAELDKSFPGRHRATRVFVGTEEPYPKHVRALPPIDGDPDARLKIVVELLTGVEARDLMPIEFQEYGAEHPLHSIPEQTDGR
jgi:hypothetical protein